MDVDSQDSEAGGEEGGRKYEEVEEGGHDGLSPPFPLVQGPLPFAAPPQTCEALLCGSLSLKYKSKM